MTETTLELQAVGKRYGDDHAVRDVDLRAVAGECLALVGHNGAGKTTLMKLMLGLIRPTSGRVRVLSENPVTSAAVRTRRGIGFLPENISFDDAMTGREVIGFFARLRGVPLASGLELLDRIGLGAASGRRVKTYSKGMRQRLGLAQSLLGEPRILMLDEPTTGLDPALRQTFYDIVRDLAGGGTTVLLSSHVLTELEARTDRVAIMNRGRLVACDTLTALRHQADLAVRIRVAVPSGQAPRIAERLAGRAKPIHVNDQTVELSCGLDGKMAVLRDIAALGVEVNDIEVAPPSFDDVYAHFSRREDQQS